MKKTNQPKGFTIIEVVLVLAIAGLIFLMVFIALPAMQRNQRDTQRRNDYSMLSSAITSYSSSNQGKLYKLLGQSSYNDKGDCKNQSAKTFINEEGVDPNGTSYTLTVCPDGKISDTVTNTKPDVGKVYVVLNADCNGVSNEGYSVPKAKNPSSTRAFAIYGYLEGGSGTYCSASQ